MYKNFDELQYWKSLLDKCYNDNILYYTYADLSNNDIALTFKHLCKIVHHNTSEEDIIITDAYLPNEVFYRCYEYFGDKVLGINIHSLNYLAQNQLLDKYYNDKTTCFRSIHEYYLCLFLAKEINEGIKVAQPILGYIHFK